MINLYGINLPSSNFIGKINLFQNLLRIVFAKNSNQFYFTLSSTHSELLFFATMFQVLAREVKDNT